VPVENVYILPTPAPLIGLAMLASEIDGRCLDLDARKQAPASTEEAVHEVS
jgi:hypothetical protein